MTEITEDTPMDTQEIEQETPPDDVFMAPSVHRSSIISGSSYSHFSPIPSDISTDTSKECVMGIDEAGRGPVLGPMVYALFYLPIELHHSLLAATHHFDDSKKLTPAVRSDLMAKICTADTDLYQSCGWATRLLSARDISSGMLHPTSMYNLNAQAMDTTIELIKQVLASGVNVKELYIDTIGKPMTYQKKLERIFPTIKITVAEKADSKYPCVSAASVCAKVTRDAALDLEHEAYISASKGGQQETWGSGYPSDGKTSGWLKRNMDPVFGWGNECRFSWGTAKELLEKKGQGMKVDWPEEDEPDGMKMTDFWAANRDEEEGELVGWYGRRVTEEVF